MQKTLKKYFGFESVCELTNCRECAFKKYQLAQENKKNNILGIAGIVFVLVIFALAFILL